MSFAIMRMEKIKSAGSLRRALEHDTRDRQPKNADPGRTDENWYQESSVEKIMGVYHEKLPEKVRKNAVHAIELVFTSSDGEHVIKGADGKNLTYTNACREWATELFGAENVLLRATHRDEKTVHAHMIIMPLKDGKLNAKKFIGGSRERMRELQDDFFEKVGKRFGLERGKSREQTGATHSPHDLGVWEANLHQREEVLAAAKRDLKIPQLRGEEIGEQLRIQGLPTDKVAAFWKEWVSSLPAIVKAVIERVNAKDERYVQQNAKKQENQSKRSR